MEQIETPEQRSRHHAHTRACNAEIRSLPVRRPVWLHALRPPYLSGWLGRSWESTVWEEHVPFECERGDETELRDSLVSAHWEQLFG
ncbi:hypothetical protein IscW_ISCW010096 [Ixodes scapularis]|uniref:Uncharacterized protein n=1 Tax=Ixodes scapularis TaxID=6945 RepID=B7Q0M4_IXOSC|nr:hypothetical protein IscW_ISCW010096 [Ixodes scapularis]|eukprot:XP_002408011.1 hypothetical protein IscW_ISCW010096 [Ixodes scapularis]